MDLENISDLNSSDSEAADLEEELGLSDKTKSSKKSGKNSKGWLYISVFNAFHCRLQIAIAV